MSLRPGSNDIKESNSLSKTAKLPNCSPIACCTFCVMSSCVPQDLYYFADGSAEYHQCTFYLKFRSTGTFGTGVSTFQTVPRIERKAGCLFYVGIPQTVAPSFLMQLCKTSTFRSVPILLVALGRNVPCSTISSPAYLLYEVNHELNLLAL